MGIPFDHLLIVRMESVIGNFLIMMIFSDMIIHWHYNDDTYCDNVELEDYNHSSSFQYLGGNQVLL